MAGRKRTELKRVLYQNPAANRRLSLLGYQQIVKGLENGDL